MSNLDDWAPIKFGDLVEGYRGVSYQPSDLLEENTPQSLVLLRATNIQNGRLNFSDIQIVPEKIVKPVQRLNLGDIAVCMSNGSKRLVGKSAQLTVKNGFDCTVGAFCSVFRPKSDSVASFVNQLFGSNFYQAHIDISLAGSAINNLKNSDIELIPITVPSKSIQKKIGNILETLDQAIEKTETLIEKYQQIKAGLMHDLFTCGITVDGKLRPPREQAPELYQETPIGWIPKDWQYGELKGFVRSAQYGISTSLSDLEVGIPVLRMNNIQSNMFDVTDLKYTNDIEAYKIKLKNGDVLYNRTNSMEHVGKTAIWRDELDSCSFASYLVRINLHEDMLLSEYFSHWMSLDSSQIALRRYATPAVQQVNINPTNLQKITISCPVDLAEQKLIVARLDSLDDKLNKEKEKLGKMNYQKSGLMHDLLTGKVPVTINDGETND